MIVPLITIDGPSSSGKGTVATLLARKLGWSMLDSGVLYRIISLLVKKYSLNFNDNKLFKDVIQKSNIQLLDEKIFLNKQDVTNEIRTETVGNDASQIAEIPLVRSILLEWQRSYINDQDQGLVADGRDMGTVVFPEAPLKIFLTASIEERAKRRYRQLKEKGISASLPRLVEEIIERDKRDINRSFSPLRAANDAIIIESSLLSINEVIDKITQNIVKVFQITI